MQTKQVWEPLHLSIYHFLSLSQSQSRSLAHSHTLALSLFHTHALGALQLSAIADLYWKGPGEELEVSVEMVDVKDWKADTELEGKVTRAYSVLDHLAHTELCPIPDCCRPLSSANSRGQICTMSRFLWSQFRDALNNEDTDAANNTVDCVILNGGDIRGGRDYTDDAYFSLEGMFSPSSLVHPQGGCV